MFQTKIRTAIRVFKKEKTFMIINVLGLSLGIWCSLLIALWVQDEYNQDKFHKNGEQIYKVIRNEKVDKQIVSTKFGTAYPIGPALEQEVPEIENIIRYAQPRKGVMQVSDTFIEADIAAVDAGFFNVFSFVLKEGNPKKCLKDVNDIVVSEEFASRYFEEGNSVGKTIKTVINETDFTFTISGVFKKIPQKSSMQFDAVIPVYNYLQFNNESWGNSWLTTYAVVDTNAKVEDVLPKIEKLPARKADVDWFTLSLQPFHEIYLYSKFRNGIATGGRIDYVILFSFIAIFTLLIACFNFINLTTSWSIKRSREIGVKKILGAKRGTLIGQFIFESIIFVTISLVLGVLCTQISISWFNEVTSKQLEIQYFDFTFYGILLMIGLFTVVCSAIYPAFFLSSFNAVSALKGKISNSINQTMLRKSLVVIQFGISIIMVAGTIVVYFQLDYILNKNLGLDKENVIYMPMDANIYKQAEAFKSELAKFPGIVSVSSSNSDLMTPIGNSSDPVWEGKTENEGQLWFSILDVDFGLIEMLNLDITKGRSFSKRLSSDTIHYIINEEAAKLMNIKDPINASLRFWGDENGKIVGVVKDFHFTSLRSPIAPMIIRCRPTNTDMLYIKTLPQKTKESISYLEQLHKRFSSFPFDFHFLDETIEKSYKEEQRVQKIGGIFSALAIFISSMGLFGLASFTANRRAKEIAIRKVLGASSFGVFNMLSKECLKLVLVSSLFSIPFAWYIVNGWIQDFAFRIDIQWWMFAIASIVVLLIALSTVSYQSIRSAKTNPVKSLKTE